MNSKKLFIRLILLFIGFTFLSCASSTESGEVGANRGQLMLISSEEITAMASKTYEETKKEAKAKNALDTNPEQYRRVLEISKKLIPHTSTFRKDAVGWRWEVHVLTTPELNAYCMPGGKIMFYTGIIEKLKLTDAEIAAIMGHEIAHALREHGRERMSKELVKQLGIQGLVMGGVIDEKYAGLAVVGASVFMLRYDRGQESEADDIGVELMARAGYDPREAVNLWKKMSSVSGGKGNPEFLSTHPSDKTRIARIESLLPRVMPLYQSTIK